jgi:hypothetical protein
VREAAEAGDDPVVRDDGAERLLLRVGLDRAEELDRALLVGERFRVLERDVEEPALDRGELPVEAARERSPGDLPRARVARERARRAAEEVSRQLVEEDLERDRALRRLLPGGEVSAERALDERREAPAAFRVEGRVLREPALARRTALRIVRGAEPELENLPDGTLVRGRLASILLAADQGRAS